LRTHFFAGRAAVVLSHGGIEAEEAGGGGFRAIYVPAGVEPLQHTALRRAGCEALLTDELSGAMTKRPAPLHEETRTRRHARLFSKRVRKLDRLGRSLCDPITMLDGLRDRGVTQLC